LGIKNNIFFIAAYLGCGWRLSSTGAQRSRSAAEGAEASTAILLYAARSCTSGLDSGSQPKPQVHPKKSMKGKRVSEERVAHPCLVIEAATGKKVMVGRDPGESQ